VQTGTNINTPTHKLKFELPKKTSREVKIEMADEKKSSIWLRIIEIVAGLIILVLAGYVIAYPGLTLLTLATFLAIALIILGIISFVRVFARGISGWQRLLSLILAILEIIIAALIIDNIVYGILTIVFLLGLGLLFAGIASASRGTPGSLIVGILGIIAGFIVIINPVIGGLTMVALAAVFLIVFGLESIVSGIVGRWV
jgi:uncharacterized membrane protein HdeD (DUF308 family)